MDKSWKVALTWVVVVEDDEVRMQELMQSMELSTAKVGKNGEFTGLYVREFVETVA
jgi:hypothetical protein